MTHKPHWLVLATEAYGGRGGIAQYNRDFLSALAASDQTSSIAVLVRAAPDPAEPQVGIRQLAPRPRKWAYALEALTSAMSRPVDVVFCGHLHMAVLAAAIARVKNAKLVIQLHGIEAWQCPSRLQRAALESADLVLAVSRHTRSRVLTWSAVAPERVLVLPNTVAEAFIPGDGSALRAELRLERRRVLLTVGRLDARERYKGHDRIIAAIPALVAQGHDVAYVIIGEGEDRARLGALAREAGIAERVLFLGAVSPDRLAACYRMADLYVMPSTGEGFGIAFLEAMASGTPALGLDVAGARDALGEGELGTLVAEDELVASIARLLAEPRREPSALSESIRRRFGRDAFRARLGNALDRMASA